MALPAESLTAREPATLDAWLESLLERAHVATVQSSPSQMAASLQRMLGQRIVAQMAGVADPKAVGRWARGERLPRGDAERRLRDAYQIAALLTIADSEETARAWFIGMNPHFRNRAPFVVLSETPAQAPAILEAAQAFVVNGS
jgi:hypothetical protein